jgi:hypothetical protein
MPKHTVTRPRSILPYRNRTSIIKKKTHRPLIPPPIKIPEILGHNSPLSWLERQHKENERIYKQSRVVDDFIRLFEILKTTTDKFHHSYFDTLQFLYVQAPGIIMRILKECTKDDISDDNKTKIIGLIIAKTFPLYVPNHEEYIKAIEATIDAETIKCINEKSQSYNVLKNPDWSKMKTKKSIKSIKKSVKKKKKSIKKKKSVKSIKKKSVKKSVKSIKKKSIKKR